MLALDGEAAQRLLLTPHFAGVTRQSAAFLFRAAWENVERVVIGGAPPLHRANLRRRHGGAEMWGLAEPREPIMVAAMMKDDR